MQRKVKQKGLQTQIERMKRLLLVAAVAALLSGCSKSNEPKQDCNYDECSQKAPNTEIESVKTFLTQNGITATQHCSGVFYAIDSVGTGATPSVCSYIAFRYTGTLTNGNVFDKSETTTGLIPLSNLVRGWVAVLPKIKQGGGMRLYIPPTLGYGAQEVKDRNGNVLIPANSIIIFDVKLDNVVQ